MALHIKKCKVCNKIQQIDNFMKIIKTVNTELTTCNNCTCKFDNCKNKAINLQFCNKHTKLERGHYCLIWENMTDIKKQKIINKFKKTSIYIKTHNITGLKYVGLSTADTNEKVHIYKGSGPIWKNELKLYGNDYTTEIIGVFNDAEKSYEFCIDFSIKNNIVKSDEWANMMYEDGIGCGSLYCANMNDEQKKEHSDKIKQTLNKRSKEQKEAHKKNTSIAAKQRIAKMTTEERIKSTIKMNNKNRNKSKKEKIKIYKKMSESHKERYKNMTEEDKNNRSKNISDGRKGIILKKITCPKCKKVGDISNMMRYHGKNGEKCTLTVHKMREFLCNKGIKGCHKLNKNQLIQKAKDNNLEFPSTKQ